MVTHLFAGLPVSDLDAALDWYERFCGRPPDNRPNPDEAVWQLVPSGLIYVVRDEDRAGRGLLTVIVDDLDVMIEGLADRGIAPRAVDVLPEIARRAVISDPDENRLTLAQLER
jgi:catechol 2,3-dioxygenase-like lactoylglutathione lyase family enzyme